MPKSQSSYFDTTRRRHEDDEDDDDPSGDEHTGLQSPYTGTSSPVYRRSRPRTARSSDLDLHTHIPTKPSNHVDERSSLLHARDGGANRSYMSVPGTPRGPPHLSRQNSVRFPRNHSRVGSFGARLANALIADRTPGAEALQDSKASLYHDNRVWYDQFTSTDWVHDSIADAYRVKELRSRKDIRGRIEAWFDGAQGWLLVGIIGCITSAIAYFVNVSESLLFDYKTGYCSSGLYMNKKSCCAGASQCVDWKHWSDVIHIGGLSAEAVEYLSYLLIAVLFAAAACVLTLTTKTVIPSSISLSTLDENLAAENRSDDVDGKKSTLPTQKHGKSQGRGPMVYYPAAGSGVAEVKVILSGFVLHGYLGVKTLVVKTIALVLAVSSGLALGKEGPYVHIATCVGNIACRLFSKYNHNDGKRREVLSASAASGVAVAFGAPIGGVLFGLEEVSYYFPPKTLFRTFFCCIVAALSLKFLNPYGTHKIVIFEVRYLTDWELFEMVAFVILGILGGALGALFIKASGLWARTFRRIPFIRKWPMLEVMLVALLTGLISYWNRYTKLPVTELLFELASPCDAFTESGTGLCPTKDQIPTVIGYLCIAFIIKAFLTTITFGIKVPAGIYVPSMVVGGILGRIVGHIVQYIALTYSHTGFFGPRCSADASPENCVVPGVYALVAAGATMCGVTRLSVTLAVILFELTGSLDHVLPFSIGVLVSKWTADALEPLSIYDLLTDMNSYPYLDNKVRPLFTSELADLVSPRLHRHRVIDITDRPTVPAGVLRKKLEHLHLAGELDGGLPLVQDGVLVGLIPAPDLEFALDRLEDRLGPARFDEHECMMSTVVRWAETGEEERDRGRRRRASVREDEGEGEVVEEEDFTAFIDPAPVSLDYHSPMDLVYECFVKLGLRYICVLRDGKYVGLVHKKSFVQYIKTLEQEDGDQRKKPRRIFRLWH
ncbi:hypothetical protein P152DRAFT_452526 [Eremomyces bilateralis CBS 781.70]|uniref:Chloride channel protein n=1 Tax=Eremomyces bilateralis CBS 781.70 TaxID=1392243 RepID=A0A6G1FSW1_9PEZI|nr:uncharacterized protein P152DRAFT_452526 [Eremomyces bilateralis CBS 781.70]KAF1808877.1 hypothetical protein P152DRAFT_452526 [Eremomyces bilateralis CBS 781.70]